MRSKHTKLLVILIFLFAFLVSGLYQFNKTLCTIDLGRGYYGSDTSYIILYTTCPPKQPPSPKMIQY